MLERIARINWAFSADPTRKRFGFKQRLLYVIEKLSGWRPGEFRNFKRIRP
jgi:hypothetical protein